jgi:hypothetical protein
MRQAALKVPAELAHLGNLRGVYRTCRPYVIGMLIAFGFFALAVFFIAMVIILSRPNPPPPYLSNWIVGAVLVCLVAGSVGIVFALLCLQTRGQRIFLFTGGLGFENGKRFIAFPWEEIGSIQQYEQEKNYGDVFAGESLVVAHGYRITSCDGSTYEMNLKGVPGGQVIARTLEEETLSRRLPTSAAKAKEDRDKK